MHQPLSFDELSTALASAHEEVANLRRRYDELQALVSKRLGAEIRDQVKLSPGAVSTEKVEPDTDNGRVETRDVGSQAQPRVVVPPAPLPSDVPTEIASLSENEAKIVLNVSGLSSCVTGG